MKKIMNTFMAFFLLHMGGEVIAAGIPVYDASSFLHQVKQITEMGKHLEQLQKQVSEAKLIRKKTEEQYKSFTGNRDLGSYANDPKLRNYLPTDYKNIYGESGSGEHGISGAISDIMRAEEFSNSESVTEIQKKIQARSKRNAATNKALGLKGYEGSQKRLQQIDLLMKKINDTQDPKAISELQARITAEQAVIQNETTRLQMIRQLQVAEQQLVEEQKREMNRRLLNTANQGMPRIK